MHSFTITKFIFLLNFDVFCLLYFLFVLLEPLLYVNERPFVLRDGDDPYVNIENTGITTRRLEAMERQLRRDVLEESQRMRNTIAQQQQTQHHTAGNTASLEESATASPNPAVLDHSHLTIPSPFPLTASPPIPSSSSPSPPMDRVLLHDEDENGNLIAVWHDSVSKNNIQTPQMAFLRCFDEVSNQSKNATTTTTTTEDGWSFQANYYRTPITDEQAPSPSTLNDIVAALETARYSPTPILLFNCQMGRGRTTTGLIIACLWCIHRNKIKDADAWLHPADSNAKTKRSVNNNISSPSPQPTRSIFNGSAAGSSTTTTTTSAFLPNIITTSTSSTYMEPSTITGDDEQSANRREDEFANVNNTHQHIRSTQRKSFKFFSP